MLRGIGCLADRLRTGGALDDLLQRVHPECRKRMDNWDTKLSARTVWENLCACEPRAMLGSRSPVA